MLLMCIPVRQLSGNVRSIDEWTSASSREARKSSIDSVVAILRNTEKGNPLFTVPEREEMIFEATRSFGNVSVTTFDGLLVDFWQAAGGEGSAARDSSHQRL